MHLPRSHRGRSKRGTAILRKARALDVPHLLLQFLLRWIVRQLRISAIECFSSCPSSVHCVSRGEIVLVNCRKSAPARSRIAQSRAGWRSPPPAPRPQSAFSLHSVDPTTPATPVEVPPRKRRAQSAAAAASADSPAWRADRAARDSTCRRTTGSPHRWRGWRLRPAAPNGATRALSVDLLAAAAARGSRLQTPAAASLARMSSMRLRLTPKSL